MTALQGQTALISGGLGDIGKAIARELARQGANIALGDIHEEARALHFVNELNALGVRSRYDRVDVSDAGHVTLWVALVEDELGVPNLIVPNAAIVEQARYAQVTPEAWRRQIAVNLDGAFYMAHAAIQRLLHHKLPGRVVFIGSWVAHAPRPHIPVYCVSKAGLRMLCKSMALEFAPHNILINEVAPGNVDAGLSAQIFRKNPELRAPHEQMIPIGKMMSAEDVAFQVAHLCNPRTTQMTGSTLLVDGGLSLLSDRSVEA